MLFGKPKLTECPLDRQVAEARDANKAAADKLLSAVDLALKGCGGTIAVFQAIEASNRKVAGRG